MRALALLLAITAPVAAPRALTVTLAPDAEAAWVPFEITGGNQIRFGMTLDGHPITAVLDTGVSTSVLAQRYVDAQHLSERAGGRAQAVGGEVTVGWVDTGTVAIGGLTRTGGGVSVAPLPAIATGGAEPVDLLVGRDLIQAAALDIDFAHHRFRLIPSGRMPFTGAVAPLSVSAHENVYVTQLSLGATTLSPVMVDTGDGSAITVTQRGWRAAALDTPTTSAIAFGLAGSFVSTVTVAPSARLGTLVTGPVEVRAEAAGGFSDAIGVDGRIGTGFLQNYRVLLDPGARHMVLQPGPGADQPPLKSTSGLLLGVAADRLEVVHVMANGPAARAGWKTGDAICSVDGTRIGPGYSGSVLASWTIGTPGRTVKLGMCDGTRRDLTLAMFY